ncbi:tRNA wybutosine-synthesizing protein 3 homolog isoform X1 [Rhinatrema bivittatum]|uniref:tRNA wybutosine-synthesizing protein 3 homolog isoform X1 n=1 Tax=Rhinatrema bivittatum TaxID=194408 RepID=UPI00112C0B3B|nr:tRNA wybutosine-synthesizing protein 3 homolog isoform X1 [Rhinatrema bivittatum]
MLLTSSFLARLMCCFSVLLVYPMEISEVFKKRKEQCLSRADLSRKGNVDADIVSLVRFINERDPFFTTSSCSGRVTLIDGCSHDFEVKKKNCSWLLVTHQKCQKDDVIAALQRASGDAVLKFEPFVLHVQCRQLEDAQLLHSVALNAGFRNSGITVGKKGKTVMAVRSTHGLEVPLSRMGKLLVNEEYIEFVVQIANGKLEENTKRIERFYSCLQSALRSEGILGKSVLEVQGSRSVYTRRRKKQARKNDGARASPEDGERAGEEELEFDPAIFGKLRL